MATRYNTIQEFTYAALSYHKNHSSIQAIGSECKKVNGFEFTHVTPAQVYHIIKNTKKANGVDLLPAKALTVASDLLVPQLSMLCNKCVDSCYFPEGVKEVIPIYK